MLWSFLWTDTLVRQSRSAGMALILVLPAARCLRRARILRPRSGVLRPGMRPGLRLRELHEIGREEGWFLRSVEEHQRLTLGFDLSSNAPPFDDSARAFLCLCGHASDLMRKLCAFLRQPAFPLSKPYRDAVLENPRSTHSSHVLSTSSNAFRRRSAVLTCQPNVTSRS